MNRLIRREAVTVAAAAVLVLLAAVPGAAPALAADGADLTVGAVTGLTVGRSYPWAISTAVVGQDAKTYWEDGTASFDYQVTVTPLPDAGTGWLMTGLVEVTNPNPQPVAVSISAGADLGAQASCWLSPADPGVLDPQGGVVEVVGTLTVPVYCRAADVPAGDPATGGPVNVLVVAWDGGAVGSPRSQVLVAVPAADLAVDEAVAHRAVEVFDAVFGGPDPAAPRRLGMVAWSATGEPTVFKFSAAHAGPPDDTPARYTHHAWIAQTGLSAAATVEVLSPAPPPAVATPSPVPTATAEPSPTPTPTEVPSSDPDPDPTATATPTATLTPAPATPAATPDPQQPLLTTGSSPRQPAAGTTRPSPSPSMPLLFTGTPGALARTGAVVGGLGVLAAALVGVGALMRRRADAGQ